MLNRASERLKYSINGSGPREKLIRASSCIVEREMLCYQRSGHLIVAEQIVIENQIGGAARCSSSRAAAELYASIFTCRAGLLMNFNVAVHDGLCKKVGVVI